MSRQRSCAAGGVRRRRLPGMDSYTELATKTAQLLAAGSTKEELIEVLAYLQAQINAGELEAEARY
jgi:alkylhydroperoxidase/carboxymuconolactone decarboxylase family protein YurZ